MKKAELARRKIDELRNNEGLFVSIKYTSTWNKDGEKTTFTSIPSREAIKSAALDIRHFIAPGSPLIMRALVNELREKPDVDIDKLNEFYDAWRRAVGDKKTKSAPHGVALNMDGKDLSLREQIDLWNNGELFHVGNEKTDKLSQMYFDSFRDMSWMIFVSTLQDLAKLLFYFDKNFLKQSKPAEK